MNLFVIFKKVVKVHKCKLVYVNHESDVWFYKYLAVEELDLNWPS
jgi:hypothetical protein